MNPLALFLLAAAAGSQRRPEGYNYGSSENPPLRLNALVSQLQGAINTLEKVGELSRMGNKLSSGIAAPPPLDAPSSAHIPVSAEVLEESRESSSAHPAPPAFPDVDLQSALQSLGPLLSMLGNNQNPK